MSERSDEILKAATHLAEVHDAWAEDEQSVLPTRALERAVLDLVEVCATGDVPGECRDLTEAVARLGVEWSAYADGAMKRDGTPRGSLWLAMQAVFDQLVRAETATPHAIEPVGLLLAQMKDFPGRHLQIARMYGHRAERRDGSSRWEGPFFDAHERPRVDLIEKEGAEPGSVIPADWVHPSEAARCQAENERHAQRIERTGEAAQPTTLDPATVEQLLREGQYPDVIARVKGTTEAAVRDEAARLGVVPNERPNLRAARAYEEQPIPEGALGGATAPKPAAADERPKRARKAAPASPVEPGMSAEDLDAAIGLLLAVDSSLGAPDLARRIKEEHGATVSVQAVADRLAEMQAA